MSGERVPGRAAGALLAALFCGCQAGYVLKQGARHLALRGRAVPIEGSELAAEVGSGAAEKLRWVPRILELCRGDLGLDPGGSYRTYLDIGEGPVSHAVTASHPLALIPYEWRFPFAGRVPYKAHFDAADARAEAEGLRALGLDVLVAPVGAFSTLGWFDDPVLSTMLEGSVADLADVIIHEATHRTVYFPGAATFNESLATFVAREGTCRFLRSRPELQGLLPGYLAERSAAAEREEVILRLRDDLDALYRGPLDAPEKLARKAEVFATAARALEILEPSAPARGSPASNALVLSAARYHELEPLLERLSEKLCGRIADLVRYLRSLPPGADPAAEVQRFLSRRPAELDA
ncbi:MAG: aminopeptidase [Planctomycetes bacterium]|nr:aminopeptidase [Planctomycetota bacterium]